MAEGKQRLGMLVARRWLHLANSLPPRALHDLLAYRWHSLALSSGVLSLVTYLASNNAPLFREVDWFGTYRQDLYGALLLSAFGFSLVSFLLSCTLAWQLQLVGEPQVVWFTRELCFLFDLPFWGCITALCFLIASYLVVIGGSFGSGVWYYAFVLAGLLLATTLACVFLVARRVAAKMHGATSSLTLHTPPSHVPTMDSSVSLSQASQESLRPLPLGLPEEGQSPHQPHPPLTELSRLQVPTREPVRLPAPRSRAPTLADAALSTDSLSPAQPSPYFATPSDSSSALGGLAGESSASSSASSYQPIPPWGPGAPPVSFTQPTPEVQAHIQDLLPMEPSNPSYGSTSNQSDARLRSHSRYG